MHFPPEIVHGPPPGIVPLTQEYYVQDTRTYTGNSVMWWCPEGNGYTTRIDQAGKYTSNEINHMRPTDRPWPVEYIDQRWSHHVDIQDLKWKWPP